VGRYLALGGLVLLCAQACSDNGSGDDGASGDGLDKGSPPQEQMGDPPTQYGNPTAMNDRPGTTDGGVVPGSDAQTRADPCAEEVTHDGTLNWAIYDTGELREMVAHVTHVTGDLGLRPPAPLDFPCLRVVDGDLSIRDYGGFATSEGFPALESVGGDLTVQDNRTAIDLAFPKLAVVGGELAMLANSSITTMAVPIDLPVLAEVGSIWFANTPADSVNLNSLAKVAGDLKLELLPSLGPLQLPELTAIEGGLTMTQLGTLGTLELPKLVRVGGALSITEWTDLENLSAPMLAEVAGAFTVADTNLDPCAVADLAEAAGATCSECTGNVGGGGLCF